MKMRLGGGFFVYIRRRWVNASY